MRLFLGATLSQPLIDRIISFQHRLTGWPIRMIKPENLHLTLVPPWEAADALIARDRLQQMAFALRSGSVQFDRWQTHGARRDGMIWLKGKADPALVSLKAILMAAFYESADTYPFVPHVTLARFHQKDSGTLPPLDEPATFCETIGNVTLFESVIGQHGADYFPRFTLPLPPSASVYSASTITQSPEPGTPTS